jgi:fibronectin type 3 domain-containing protein
VYRSTASGGPYTLLATTPSTIYADAALPNGTTYYYRVTASSISAESSNSNEASAITVPAAPSNLIATFGVGQIALSWSAVTGATGFMVLRSTASGGTYTQIATTTSTSYADAALANDTTYYYVVKAINASGISANSNESSATTMGLSSNIGDVAVDVGNSTIKKLKAADGTVLWSASVTNDGAIAVDQLDFGVYTGYGSHSFGSPGTVYKYNASGVLAWTNSISRSGPAISIT